MSTFCGFFKEIPYISVDRFEIENRKCKLFFLSHCHTDHMEGLFGNRLGGPLYTSAISAVFLKNRFPQLTDNLRVLDIDVSTKIVYEVDGKSCTLVVTAVAAQHCPGSVMFLFETREYTVLYTGDFRLRKTDFPKLSILKEKHIDSVYLDTTFFLKRYMYFPAPIDSINAIIKTTNEWLQKGDSYRIILETAARYGSEYLVMELGRKLNCKIFVEPILWDQYIYISAMDQFISQDPNECQVLSRLKSSYDTFGQNRSYNYKLLRPSAFLWTKWMEGDSIIKEEGTYIFKACISYHSSFSEIRDFLKFIRPTIIRPNVVHESCDDKRELYSNIRTILEEIAKEDKISIAESSSTKITIESFKFKSIFTLIQEESSEEEGSKVKNLCLLPKRRRL